MKVYVTGVSGFLGGLLASRLIDGGHEVAGSGSRPASAERTDSRLDRFDALPLGGRIPPTTFDGVDAVIHAAYDPRPGTEELNVEGTDRLRRAATASGVERQLFLGSLSADAEAHSEYGRQKFRLEQIFLDQRLHVARCGLVIGNGGLFRRMMGLVWRLPVLPLLDGGRAPTRVTSPRDLGAFVDRWLVGQLPPGIYNLFNPDPVPLGEILLALRDALGCRTVLLPVPSALLLAPLRLARLLRLPLPVSEENVQGYRSNRRVERKSDYPSILERFQTFDSMLTAAANDFSTQKGKTA